MNKVYSKKELKAKAQEVFEQYPSEDKVFAREDGNIFFNENLAELGRGKLKVYPFDRNDIVKTDESVEDIDVNMEVINNIKTGESTGQIMEAIPANSDGSVNVLEVDAPAVDDPKFDIPEVEAPKVDTPAVDASKVDTPAVDDPKFDIPEVEAPKVDTPAVDASKVDTPAVDDPKFDIPEVEAPKVDTPAVDASKVNKTLGKDGKNPETRKSNKNR